MSFWWVYCFAGPILVFLVEYPELEYACVGPFPCRFELLAAEIHPPDHWSWRQVVAWKGQWDVAVAASCRLVVVV